MENFKAHRPDHISCYACDVMRCPTFMCLIQNKIRKESALFGVSIIHVLKNWIF